MKNVFLTLFASLFWLAACAPSEQAVQTAIARTQAANPTFTLSPKPTSTQRSTLTPDPKNVYVLDAGLCPRPDMAIDEISSLCFKEGESEKVTFSGAYNSVTVTLPDKGVLSDWYPYCVLSGHDGTLVSAHIENDAAAEKVTCGINEPTPTPKPTVGVATQTFIAEAETRLPKGDGFYLVGSDIAPGVWRSTGTGDGCYWSVTSKTGDIIDNHFGMAGGTAYIPANGFQVEFSDCGTWEYLSP